MVGQNRSYKRSQGNDASQPMVYHITIKGHLASKWSAWMGGLAITLQEDGNTLLTGPVIDQAALYGIIRTIRDLGMPLLSVYLVGSGPDDPGEDK